MNVRYAKDEQKIFDAFILKNKGSFLQCSGWGELQHRSGRKMFKLLVQDQEEILLSALVLKYPEPFKKSYLYIPYGPVFNSNITEQKAKEAFALLLEKLKERAEKEDAMFLKVELDDLKIDLGLEGLGFIKSEKDAQARETLIMDVTQDEDVILKNMKQKTRYNIKVAQKHGVEVMEPENKKQAFDNLYDLMKATEKRNGFSLHPKNYYQNMSDMFLGKEGVISQKIYVAKKGETVLASALVSFHGKRATYLFGGSSDEYKNVMAPHLLHWHIIKDAKNMGCTEYDWWGIVTEKTRDDKKSVWSGFSRFKLGFGGNVVEYKGAYDLIFDKVWYFMYKIARKVL